MKNKFTTVVVTILLTVIILFAVNYFTLLGYYLPHKHHIIYENYSDTYVQETPAFIAIGQTPRGVINQP